MKTLKEFYISGATVPTAEVYRPTDSLGIPRYLMPQLPSSAYKYFALYLIDLGIALEAIPNCPLSRIKCTQSDINLDKVREMIDVLDGISTGEFQPSFIISSDYYLLDGHHRFMALSYSGRVTDVPVMKVNMSMQGLIPVAHAFLEDHKESVTEAKCLSHHLSEDELPHYRNLRKAYREMTWYQHRARNPKSLYGKRKYVESYLNWNSTVRAVRKSFETKRARHLIDFAMKRAGQSSRYTK